MKNLSFLVLITLYTSNCAIAQQINESSIWYLTIADSATNKGIARATVLINHEKHFITNERGGVTIKKDIRHKSDTLRISSVGYKTTSFFGPVSNLPDTIRLVASTTNLQEVFINPKPSKRIVLGDLMKKYNSHRATVPDQIYVEYIPNDKKVKGTITSIQYVVNNIRYGIDRPFKIALYTKSSDNPFPDQELIKDSFIVYNPERKTHLNVDISKYNIQLPEDGIMVALETLPASYYGKDSIWYKGFQYSKTPGIDMDLKKAGEFVAHPHNLDDRKTPYSMVINAADKWDQYQLILHSYLYDDGNNFAITITVAPE